MSIENPHFERKVLGEEAFVLRSGKDNLFHPRLIKALEPTGLSRIEFSKLVYGKPEWIKPPAWEEFYSTKGKLEDLNLGIARTSVGQAEVSDVRFYGDGIDPEDIGFRLQDRSDRPKRFETIIITQGSASMYFPDSVDAIAAGVYASSESGEEIELQAGDLVFLPSPTAMAWRSASKDCEFRYIGLPPWEKDIIVNAL